MAATLVLPGDQIPIPSTSRNIIIGPGIAAADNASPSSAPALVATRLGMLHTGKGKEKSQKVWIEGNSKRYIPAQKDMVLGVIIARHSEGYRVDLGSAQMAQLDALSFEGATKRSKPNLKVGTLVFARVISASRDMEPELECFDANTGKSDGFGELKGGVMINCTLQLCRQLLNRNYPLLPAIASAFPFEISIGLNGRVWLKAETVSETLAMKRVIEGVNDGVLGVEEAAVKAKIQEYMA
ncbi:exosome complex component RRP40 [Cryptococcus wingfieldii CBS 7118]|uniref:Ribosomal RNA-processing protein 40 n=1 Tax=Cryptococcus wingfieldii CBS 7118 TaxID=1295528 RepID=A0A1E3JWK0_9TREE|nr:exosome complex component RRP40 [Cryptococcus wingfieldii CBS 7118]ODO05238.1 exosome complex component RRP40 [Cryptococcus wingfieldii CBS 7118]